MKLQLTAFAALAAALAGCAAHGIPSALPAPITQATANPYIRQNSTQWIDLTPDFNNVQALGITTGSDDAMWVFGIHQGARYTMTTGLSKFRLRVTGPNGPGTLFTPLQVVRAGTNVYATGQDWGFGGSAIFGLITPNRAVNIFPIPSGDSAAGLGVTYDPANQTVWLGENAHIGKVDVGTNAITEFPTADQIEAVAYGPDGNIWAVGYSSTGTQILVFNPSDGSVLATYPDTCVFYGLVAGSDGYLYAAEAGPCGEKFLARISTSGMITHIPLPEAPGLAPSAITLVGAGALTGHVVVVAQTGHNLMDYNPTTGLVTDITAPSQYSSDDPYSLAAGPDGNLWSTDVQGNVLVYVANLITANPTSITVNVGATATITASEPDKASLKATSSNTGIATVTKVSGDFSVTGVAVGTCTVTIKDKIGNSLKVPVTVQ